MHPGQFPLLSAQTIADDNIVAHSADWRETSPQVEFPQGQLARIRERGGRYSRHPSVTTADNIDEAYEAYCRLLIDAAKKHIPRGCRANHILC